MSVTSLHFVSKFVLILLEIFTVTVEMDII